MTDAQKRELSAQQKALDLERALERAEQEQAATLAELRLTTRRVEALQQVAQCANSPD